MQPGAVAAVYPAMLLVSWCWLAFAASPVLHRIWLAVCAYAETRQVMNVYGVLSILLWHHAAVVAPEVLGECIQFLQVCTSDSRVVLNGAFSDLYGQCL